MTTAPRCPDCIRLADAGPYRAWKLNPRAEVWGIAGAGGWNCLALPGGAVMVQSQERAEAIIRAQGFVPAEARLA